ncbi:trigger factor [Thermotoga profunda]|uniref:trigger factor n=1 Tax=Thermotoga profunda TaxID=1508420 RepID=UPI0005979D1E|nr:trigger factor [Thermotoga profunda]
MQKNIKTQEKNLVVCEYTFTKDEVAQAEENAIKQIADRVDIPGFRKGRAPKHLLRMRYPETIKSEMLEILWQKISEEIDISEELLLSPILEDFEISKDGAKLVLQIHKKPEIVIKPFEEFELKRLDKPSTLNGYVERRLKELQEFHAVLEPKEGPADFGDMVRVKMTITTDDKVVMNEKINEYVLYKEDDRPIVTEVVGKKAGDVVEFDRDFGKNKVYHYKIEIEQVNKRKLLDISDELAKAVGTEYETLQQLKEALEKEGSELYERDMKEFLQNQVIDILANESELLISERTIAELVERAFEKIKQDKQEYEKLLKDHENDPEKLKEALKNYYLTDLKRTLSIEKVARENDLKVTDEEVEAQAQDLAVAWGISVDRAKSILKSRQDISNDVRWELLKRKVADIILEKAKVIDIKPEELQKEEKEHEDK